MSNNTKQRSKEWQAGAEMMRQFVIERLAEALKMVEWRMNRCALELAELSSEPGKKEFTVKATEYAGIKYEHFNAKQALENFTMWNTAKICFDAFQSNTPEAA